jgi:hypothetical protein
MVSEPTKIKPVEGKPAAEVTAIVVSVAVIVVLIVVPTAEVCPSKR